MVWRDKYTTTGWRHTSFRSALTQRPGCISRRRETRRCEDNLTNVYFDTPCFDIDQSLVDMKAEKKKNIISLRTSQLPEGQSFLECQSHWTKLVPGLTHWCLVRLRRGLSKLYQWCHALLSAPPVSNYSFKPGFVSCRKRPGILVRGSDHKNTRLSLCHYI